MKKSRLFIMMALCYLISCSSDPVRTKLTQDEEVLLDSLFNNALKEARKETNYTCQDLRDSLFQQYVDSIREIRLIEVEQIINSKIK